MTNFPHINLSNRGTVVAGKTMQAEPALDKPWQLIEGSRNIRCLACSHRCVIAPGRTGHCGVRKNEDGVLRLLVYGHSIAVNIDPVEKKPVYHFLPSTPIFSIGTIGCNFECDFCQNWDISQATRGVTGDIEESAMGRDLPPQTIVDQCVRRGIKSIAFTYNEPAIFHEYAVDTMKLARPFGIKGVFVTNGFETPEALRLLRPWIDVMRIDLKAFTNEFYQRHCKARLDPVLETIRTAKQLGYWVEVVTLLIPGENDSDDEVRRMAEFVVSVDSNIPHHFTAYHPDYHFTSAGRTPLRTILHAIEIAKRAGEKFVYSGNVVDEAHGSTYCPQCNATLISRQSMHETNIVDLDAATGSCRRCHTAIPGIWK
ncbi:AmmeMemoRadiSam system radical SAM enzyme [Paratrimastix pyriformis]|uniref:AmmeMemoRadiSam system radical SAM enzyme n=1 Tax=Paratrimastix pyriformis TaxID=342808 RepID=A0ABQ8URA3_9EUKA|nr:AmmeMemoRadiSam system radical SAM enzyme [Paratrimastix pyriformis]